MTGFPQLMTLAQWSRGSPWRLELQHSDPCHAVIWITRGQGIGTIEGTRRGIGVHNALVIPAGCLFSLSLGAQGFGQVCLIPPGGPILMPDTPQHLRSRAVQAQSALTGILDAMPREQSASRPLAEEAMRAHAWLLTVWLRRAMIANETPDAPKTAARTLVRAFCALVERDYRTGRPMADYARVLGVTPTHLTRSCRKTCGLTAADILTQRTLHAARDLLETTRDPSQAIAAQLGFSSAAYFSRFIQHHTGQPPSRLRQSSTP